MLNLARQPDCILGSSCNPGRLYTIAILSIEGSLLPFCATPRLSSFRNSLVVMAEWTGLEPATSGVTGRRSNQLNYHSAVAARAARPEVRTKT